METESHVQINLSKSHHFIKFLVFLLKLLDIMFEFLINFIFRCRFYWQNIIGKVVTMSKLNSLSGYILHVNIDDSNVMEIRSTFNHRNVINALLQDDMIVSSQNNVDILDLWRVKTIRTVSHVSQRYDKVTMVFFSKNLTNFSWMLNMVMILNFSIIHGR